MALWTPADINTALWHDASDSATITLDGGVVSAWSDKSGSANHATQSTGASRPAVVSAGQNGLDVLAFDGSNDFLRWSTAVDFLGKIIVVVAASSAAANGQIFSHSTTNIQFRYASGTGFNLAGSPAPWSGAISATSLFSVGTMAVIAFVGNGSSATLAINGTVKDTGGTQSAAANFNQIGIRSSTSEPLNGRIAEVVIADIATDRQLLEGYLAHKWGLAGALPELHPYKSAAPVGGLSAIAGSLDQQWNLQGESVAALLAQPWNLLGLISGAAHQPWGLRLGRDLVEPWANAPVRVAGLAQPWRDAGELARGLVQPWQDAAPLASGLAQEWDILAPLALGLVQPWAVAADAALVGQLVQGWDLRDVVPLSVDLAQPWSIGEDGSLLRYAVVVTVDGVAIGVSHVSIEADRAQDVLSCEIHPETEGDWLRCRFGAALVVTITSDAGVEIFRLVVTAPRISEQHGEPRWVVEAMSPAALLGDPWGAPVSGELSGLASTVAASLVAGSGVALTWATVDWAIPPACWIAADERPLSLLKTLAAAVGAVVQSQPDGSLRIEPDYPVSLPNWASSAPGLTLTETLDVFSVSSDPDYRPGYNRFLISDQAAGSTVDGLRLEEETVSATVKTCRGYQVPWTGAFTLTHTGGSWVQIEDQGVETRQEAEVVEFVAGSGRTRYPIYSRDAVEWLQTNLGTVTVAEDGTLSAAVAGQSLLRLTYTTRCRKWRVRDGRNEQLQLVAEI